MSDNFKVTIKDTEEASKKRYRLTDKEKTARKMEKQAAMDKTADVAMSEMGNFYSPQLSTDFLEKPQNLRERHAWFRHFYRSNEYIKAATDLNTTMPLTKARINKPRASNEKFAEYVHRFYLDMCERINLFDCLVGINHERNLFGNAFPFLEENDPYEELLKQIEDSETDEEEAFYKEQLAALVSYSKKRSSFLKDMGITDKDPLYRGWDRITILPPDQVRISKVPFSKYPKMEFVPDSNTRRAINGTADYSGNKGSVPNIPGKFADTNNGTGTIPLDADPDSGSHVAHLHTMKSQYETYASSPLDACINTLLLMDKLRQAQQSIASRHMTPMRLVYGEKLSDPQLDDLREQVDYALIDPDFSIITNYKVEWEEIGSNQRLLDLTSEFEIHLNALFAGLGVSREILTGESMYSGSRATLEVIIAKYTLDRNQIERFVEEHIFKPVARKKGFVEYDEFGNEKLIYPTLTFSRIALKDSDEYFNQLFQLYQKNSVSIDVILDVLGVDPEQTKRKIEADLFSVNDASFNNLLTSLYGQIGSDLASSSNVRAIIAEKTGLAINKTPEDDGGDEGFNERFASSKNGLNAKEVAMLKELLSKLGSMEK